jgi:hypothetical protein
MLGIGTNANARLGETFDQIMVRYGSGGNSSPPPSSSSITTMEFHKQNWIIIVSFFNGISAKEMYEKPGGVDDASVQALLDINSEGHTWKLTQSGPDIWAAMIPTPNAVGKRWDRDDGGAVATLQAGMRTFFTVQSKQLIDSKAALDAAQKKASEPSLKGF